MSWTYDKRYPRRPRTPYLRSLYESGASATETTQNPYLPVQRDGDKLKAHIWTQGQEDNQIANVIASLV